MIFLFEFYLRSIFSILLWSLIGFAFGVKFGLHLLAWFLVFINAQLKRMVFRLREGRTIEAKLIESVWDRVKMRLNFVLVRMMCEVVILLYWLGWIIFLLVSELVILARSLSCIQN